jgi:hypothetical protein
MPLPIDWPGATYGSGTGTPYTSPNGDTWIWTGYSWEGLIATATPSAGTVYTKELISGGASWNTGMTFDVSALTYTFFGPIQSAIATQVTLSNGDSVYDRIDAIVVNDDDPNGLVSVIEGTPAPNPITPEIPSDQLLVQYIIVPTGVTSMPISTLVIYDNNIEWTGSVVDVSGLGTFTFNSTTPTPFNSSVCLNVTGNNRRRWARFSEPTSTGITASNYALLSFRVYFTSSINISRTLTVRFRNNGSYVGNPVNVTPTFASRTVTSQWQNVVIPLNLFAIPLEFDAIDIQLTGNYTADLANWSIDLVQLQSGISPAIGVGASPKPWGIYGQGTGVLTTYNTLSQAINASVVGDCIHLFGSITENVTSAYTIENRNINLNGHYLGMTGPTSIGDVISIVKIGNIYNGTIFIDEDSPIVGPTSGVIRAGGVSIFDGLKVINNSVKGSALKVQGDLVDIIGGYFETANYHAGYINLPAEGSKIRDIEFRTRAQDFNGFYAKDGGSVEYCNIKAFNTASTIGSTGSGIYIDGGGDKMWNCYGYTKTGGTAGTSSYGLYVAGKWEISDCQGIAEGSRPNCSGMGMYIPNSRNCVARGTQVGAVIGTGTHSLLTSETEAGYGMLVKNSTTINQSKITGVQGIILDEDVLSSINGCSIEGYLIGATGSNFIVTNSTIDSSDSDLPAIQMGPDNGTNVSYFLNSVFNVSGATYGIIAEGATARDVRIINCTFIGPTIASWDTSTITNIVGATNDSQGNMKYP